MMRRENDKTAYINGGEVAPTIICGAYLKQREFDKVKLLTIIAEGVEIVGNIKTKGDINILGSVTGEVISDGHLLVQGNISGNVKANSITLEEGTIVADTVECSEKIIVGIDSEINGNTSSQDIEVSGKIIGNLNSRDSCIFYDTAFLDGNIEYGTLSIEKGASIVGTLISNLTIRDRGNYEEFEVKRETVTQ